MQPMRQQVYYSLSAPLRPGLEAYAVREGERGKKLACHVQRVNDTVYRLRKKFHVGLILRKYFPIIRKKCLVIFRVEFRLNNEAKRNIRKRGKKRDACT